MIKGAGGSNRWQGEKEMARSTGSDNAWTDTELEKLKALAEYYKGSGAIPVDDDYIERRRRMYDARRYPSTLCEEKEEHSAEPSSDKTLMKHTLMFCVGIFGLVVSAGLFMMVMLG